MFVRSAATWQASAAPPHANKPERAHKRPIGARPSIQNFALPIRVFACGQRRRAAWRTSACVCVRRPSELRETESGGRQDRYAGAVAGVNSAPTLRAEGVFLRRPVGAVLREMSRRQPPSDAATRGTMLTVRVVVLLLLGLAVCAAEMLSEYNLWFCSSLFFVRRVLHCEGADCCGAGIVAPRGRGHGGMESRRLHNILLGFYRV